MVPTHHLVQSQQMAVGVVPRQVQPVRLSAGLAAAVQVQVQTESLGWVGLLIKVAMVAVPVVVAVELVRMVSTVAVPVGLVELEQQVPYLVH